MKGRAAALGVLPLFLFLPALFAAESKFLALKEAYALALARSETVGIQKEAINEAQGRFYQALNQALPDVSFLITRQDQDALSSSSVSSDSVGGGAFRRSTPQKKFVFSQPLFSGFKEFAGIQGAGSEKAQRRFEWQRAKEILFINVVDSFYALAETRKDITILNEIEQAMAKRIRELTKRVNIGRSRESELRTAVSDLKILVADIQSARRMEIITRQLLEFYIGKEAGGDLAEEKDFNPALSEPLFYLSRRDQRNDVRGAEEAYKLAQKKVIVAQAGFFPTVKVDGNYYTQRVGFQSGTDWDTTLSVDVPVFKGTETIGKVKEAAAQRETAKLKWELAKRQAEMDIKNTFEIFRSSQLEEKALAEAVGAARESYELVSQDYRQNLASNLDVLDSLKRYEEVLRRLNQASKATKKNYWKLKVAVGEAL